MQEQKIFCPYMAPTRPLRIAPAPFSRYTERRYLCNRSRVWSKPRFLPVALFTWRF
jgi:hypothetical protein